MFACGNIAEADIGDLMIEVEEQEDGGINEKMEIEEVNDELEVEDGDANDVKIKSDETMEENGDTENKVPNFIFWMFFFFFRGGERESVNITHRLVANL